MYNKPINTHIPISVSRPVRMCMFISTHTPSHELMLKPLQIHSNTTVTLVFFFFLSGFKTSLLQQ